MVLAELGGRISNALRNVSKNAMIDDNAIRDMLNEISSGLMAADVNTKQVVKLKNNIKAKLNFEELPKGLNKRNHISKVVFAELVALLDPGVKPFRPVKNKTNIVMFVGLQGKLNITTTTSHSL